MAARNVFICIASLDFQTLHKLHITVDISEPSSPLESRNKPKKGRLKPKKFAASPRRYENSFRPRIVKALEPKWNIAARKSVSSGKVFFQSWSDTILCSARSSKDYGSPRMHSFHSRLIAVEGAVYEDVNELNLWKRRKLPS
jgi:hypothetical protein